MSEKNIILSLAHRGIEEFDIEQRDLAEEALDDPEIQQELNTYLDRMRKHVDLDELLNKMWDDIENGRRAG